MGRKVVIMEIIETLTSKGIEIIKTPALYIGYEETEAGPSATAQKEKASDGVYFLRIKTANKGELTVPCGKKTIYIAHGTEYADKIKSEDEAKELAEQGKIFSFDSADLYAEYYDFANNKELESFFKCHYSLRTKKYIESVKNRIGLLRYTESEIDSTPEGTPAEFDKIDEFKSGFYSDTEIGKLETGEWIAQTCYQFDIDGFGVMKMFFDERPTVKTIKTALTIREYEHSFIRPEVFRCWECGHLRHWLDVPGDITEKFRHLEDKYCGC